MEYAVMEGFARDAGFVHTAPLDPATIVLKDEVRQMCAACGQYGKRWSCPPGCGDLVQCAGNVSAFCGGILVQTVG